jgi:hypothetical protein
LFGWCTLGCSDGARTYRRWQAVLITEIPANFGGGWQREVLLHNVAVMALRGMFVSPEKVKAWDSGDVHMIETTILPLVEAAVRSPTQEISQQINAFVTISCGKFRIVFAPSLF